ncbi:helix-turn-helix domain-containing protein [Chloroflexota bacterium]
MAGLNIADVTTKGTVQEMLSVRQVSQLLNVHVNTVRKWSNDGVLQSYRIGPRRDRRFHREDVVSLLQVFE